MKAAQATGEVAARDAVARILASDGFRSAPRLAAFLAFVVERTLAGEAASLKGYTIATGALGRPADFDPQLDPIVRVEAGRLRRALDAYYAGPGRDDPVVVSVPRGRYVPAFQDAEPRAAESPSSTAPRAATTRVRPASAALAAAASLGFAFGLLSASLLSPRDASATLAHSARAEASRKSDPAVVPAAVTAQTD